MSDCRCPFHFRYHDINYSKLFDKFKFFHFDGYLHCAQENGHERSTKAFILWWDFFFHSLSSVRSIGEETKVSRQEIYNFYITSLFALW